eukprot:gb/GFBE01026501.1/.p1 GENE.gb/GFBE01026501.1/~~gb/GFBE01026501.1/.p1  ORF type:complete len:344 (+),score=64.26 gb/GFBE01026501.1/:1-1032(+)
MESHGLAFAAPQAARLAQIDRGHTIRIKALQRMPESGPDNFTSGRQAAAIAAGVVAVGGLRRQMRRRRAPRAPRAGGASQGTTSLVSAPQETFALLVSKAEMLSKLSTLKTLYASIMGGCYIGMAGLLSLAIAGQAANGNLVASQLIFAALFPVSLLLVLQTGGQLFTSNTATMAMGLFEKKVTTSELLKNWVGTYVGNFVGCCILAFVASYTGLLSVPGTAALARQTAMLKCASPLGVAIVKGIMCNWLVSMGIWLCTSAKDLAGKMVGIWFPISMFIAIGFEHSVANMFMLPAAILAGAPLTLADVLLKNIIPVTIGNSLAGVFVIGAGHSFAFGRMGAGK